MATAQAGEADSPQADVAQLAEKADALAAEGRFDEAVAGYQAAAAQAGEGVDRKLALSFFRWALLVAARQDFDQAREAFARALQLYGEPEEPTDANLGGIYAEWAGQLTSADAKEGADAAARAVELFGGEDAPASLGLVVAYTNWCWALTGMQRFPEAVERGERAVVLAEEAQVPDAYAGQALTNLSAALLGAQEPAAAADRAEKAVERDREVSPSPPALPMAYVNWALALARMGEWQAAIDKLSLVPAAAGDPEPPNPILAAAYLTWSGVLLNIGQVSEAEKKARLAIAFAGSDTSRRTALAYGNLASALVGLQRAAEALQNAERAIELWGKAEEPVDRDLARMYDSKADALVGLDRPDQALTASERAVELYGQPALPQDLMLASIRLTWGDALIRLGRYGEAADQYRVAVEAATSYPPSHLGYAQVLTALGRAEEAATEFERAVAEYGKQAEGVPAPGHLMWGDALNALGYGEDALEHYRRAGQLDSGLAEAHVRVASTLHKAGRYALALPAWKRASDACEARIGRAGGPSVWDLNLEALLLSEVFRDLSGAESLLYRALELAPNNLDTLAALVALHSVQAREAAATFGTAAVAGGSDEGDPFAPEWKRRLRFIEAKRLLDARLDLSGDHGPELVALGNLCLQVEDYEEAERSFELALELLPDRPEPLLGLGLVSRQTGDVKRAVRYLSRAVAAAPYELDVRRALAEAHLQAESLFDAEVEFGRILSVTNDHTQAHLGFGSVQLELAGEDSPEAYDRAVEHFTTAIDLGRDGGRPSSGRLLRSELAQVHYARGYARVKLYESSGRLKKDERLLRSAREDFTQAVALDACQYSAKRAEAQLRERSRSLAHERRRRSLGPMLVVSASLIVFAIAQVGFFLHLHHGWLRLGGTNYVAITFGALLFVVAGLSLPELLRLKVGGFELEKETVVEVSEIKPLAIAAPLSVRPAPVSGALAAHS